MTRILREMKDFAHLIRARVTVGFDRQRAFQDQRFRFERVGMPVQRTVGFPFDDDGLCETILGQEGEKSVLLHTINRDKGLIVVRRCRFTGALPFYAGARCLDRPARDGTLGASLEQVCERPYLCRDRAFSLTSP